MMIEIWILSVLLATAPAAADSLSDLGYTQSFGRLVSTPVTAYLSHAACEEAMALVLPQGEPTCVRYEAWPPGLPHADDPNAPFSSMQSVPGVRYWMPIEVENGNIVDPTPFYCFYSAKALADSPHLVKVTYWQDKHGKTLGCTAVYRDPDGDAYRWPDKVNLGQVVKFIRSAVAPGLRGPR
jgi:hypothetical protein